MLKSEYHITALVGAIALVGFLFYNQTGVVAIYDQPVTNLTMNKTFDEAHTVNVGLFVLDFKQFDVASSNFSIDCVIWFDFDSTVVDEKKVSKFFLTKGKVEKIMHAEVVTQDNKRRLAKYYSRVSFRSPLDYRNHPLDDHRISIRVANLNFDAEEILFKTADESFDSHKVLYVGQWNPVKKTTLYGYEELSLDSNNSNRSIKFPKAIFSFEFQKSAIEKIFLTYIPLYMIFFLGLFSLTLGLEINKKMIFNLALGSISALIFYRPTLDKNAPNAGYFTFSDKLFTFFIISSFVICIYQVYLYRRSLTYKTIFSLDIDTFRTLLFWAFWLVSMVGSCLLFP
jgi:hypothetical protein